MKHERKLHTATSRSLMVERRDGDEPKRNFLLRSPSVSESKGHVERTEQRKHTGMSAE